MVHGRHTLIHTSLYIPLSQLHRELLYKKTYQFFEMRTPLLIRAQLSVVPAIDIVTYTCICMNCGDLIIIRALYEIACVYRIKTPLSLSLSSYAV